MTTARAAAARLRWNRGRGAGLRAPRMAHPDRQMASSPSRPPRASSRDAARTSTARSASTRGAAPRRRAASPTDGTPVFARQNYVLLGVCIGLIVVAYAMMRAENEVDGTISLFVSPLLLLIGYLGVVPAILWRPRRNDAPAPTTTAAEAA